MIQCRGHGCFRRMTTPGPEICHSCARKERRALRRKRAEPSPERGHQDRLFIDKMSPKEQLDSWRNRK